MSSGTIRELRLLVTAIDRLSRSILPWIVILRILS